MIRPHNVGKSSCLGPSSSSFVLSFLRLVANNIDNNSNSNSSDSYDNDNNDNNNDNDNDNYNNNDNNNGPGIEPGILSVPYKMKRQQVITVSLPW